MRFVWPISVFPCRSVPLDAFLGRKQLLQVSYHQQYKQLTNSRLAVSTPALPPEGFPLSAARPTTRLTGLSFSRILLLLPPGFDQCRIGTKQESQRPELVFTLVAAGTDCHIHPGCLLRETKKYGKAVVNRDQQFLSG